MADPYATETPDLSRRPTGPPPWAELVTTRGGVIVGSTPSIPNNARFAVVACSGIGTLAPLARLDPPMAALLWLEHTPEARSSMAGNEMLVAARGAGVPLLALKQGSIGGPPDREGCFEVDDALIDPLLSAVLGEGDVGWEVDPDFGYEVPSQVDGLDAVRARALLPRLLYADHDRVYEHAGLVAAKKEERWRIARSLPGLAEEIVAAAAWPPTPTSNGWKE